MLLPLSIRTFVWGLFFCLLYILRSFFLLIFLTFVFAYVQNRGVDYLKKWIKSRTLRVFLIGSIFLGVLTGVGFFLVPKVKAQAEAFIGKAGDHVARVDLELLNLGHRYPIIMEMIPGLDSAGRLPMDPADQKARNWWRRSPTASFLLELTGMEEDADAMGNIRHMFGNLRIISQKIAAVVSAFLLALLFAFLIVLDLKKLHSSVSELEHTKLGFFYTEVADNVKDFSHVLGRALEAQLFIAIINSALTAVGITFLGLGPNVAFLSVIVFFCSFIPVAGVFISSVPICLMALQVSGLQTMFLAIALITVIHLIEAYVLNPRIFATHMRINPVIVLVILTISGKLFHVWGLVLGIPVYTYLFGHAIKYKQREKPKAANRSGKNAPGKSKRPPGVGR
ncbi:AI-2E family transporter [Fibrobacterota bacterium]